MKWLLPRGGLFVHYTLKPIELAWELVKGYIKANNCPDDDPNEESSSESDTVSDPDAPMTDDKGDDDSFTLIVHIFFTLKIHPYIHCALSPLIIAI